LNAFVGTIENGRDVFEPSKSLNKDPC